MKRPRDAHVVTLSHQGRGEAQAVSQLAALLKPTRAERIINYVVMLAGSEAFINFNLLWIWCWMIVNTGLVPGLTPFDPFPFQILLLILPIEALFLIIIVQLNQMRHNRRMARIARMQSLFDTFIQDEDAPSVTYKAERVVCPPNPGREL